MPTPTPRRRRSSSRSRARNGERKRGADPIAEQLDGRVNLTVTVPEVRQVTVNAGMGNVTATGLGAGINVTARGDIHLNSMTGPLWRASPMESTTNSLPTMCRAT